MINSPILIIFFARPDLLYKTFVEVKKAKPKVLFLACDGPRENNERDIHAIEECKKIVSDIDWDCKVHYKYSDTNLGCGLGPSSAISWAFNYTDRLIILEDDCIATQSFFKFQDELLEKYKDDERVGLISGFNHFKNWSKCKNSYFFSKAGATLGWGTWKRVWDKYDFYLEKINDESIFPYLKSQFNSNKIATMRINGWKRASLETKKQKVNYWDVQFGFLKYFYNYLVIVPKNNMICNIGVGAGSTHTEDKKIKKWKKGDILFMPSYECNFPLIHPDKIECDSEYDFKAQTLIFKKNPIRRLLNKIKRLLKL